MLTSKMFAVYTRAGLGLSCYGNKVKNTFLPLWMTQHLAPTHSAVYWEEMKDHIL